MKSKKPTLVNLERQLDKANQEIDGLLSIVSMATFNYNHLYDIRNVLTDIQLADYNEIPLAMLHRLKKDNKVDYFEFQISKSKVLVLYPKTRRNLLLYKKRTRYQNILDTVYNNELHIR